MRIDRGAESLAILRDHPVQFLLDDAAVGLQFVPGNETEPGKANLKMLHEHLAVPHVTHFVDPIPVCMQAIPSELCYQALMSNTWVKLIADPAAEWNQPSITGCCVPVGCDDRRRYQEPFFR